MFDAIVCRCLLPQRNRSLLAGAIKLLALLTAVMMECIVLGETNAYLHGRTQGVGYIVIIAMMMLGFGVLSLVAVAGERTPLLVVAILYDALVVLLTYRQLDSQPLQRSLPLVGLLSGIASGVFLCLVYGRSPPALAAKEPVLPVQPTQVAPQVRPAQPCYHPQTLQPAQPASAAGSMQPLGSAEAGYPCVTLLPTGLENPAFWPGAVHPGGHKSDH